MKAITRNATALNTCLLVLLLSATTSFAQPVDIGRFAPFERGNQWVYKHIYHDYPPGGPIGDGELRGYIVSEIVRDTLIADTTFLFFDNYEFDEYFNQISYSFCLLRLDDDGNIINSFLDPGSTGHENECSVYYVLNGKIPIPFSVYDVYYPNMDIVLGGISYVVDYAAVLHSPGAMGSGHSFYYATDIGMYTWFRRLAPRGPMSGWDQYYHLEYTRIGDQEYGKAPTISNEEEPAQGTDLDISIYPNPASTSVTIELGTYEPDGYTVTLFDITGRVVHTGEFGSGLSVMTIPVAQLGSGTYIVRVMDQTGNQAVRLLTRP